MARIIQLTDGTNTVDFVAATGIRGQPSWLQKISYPTGDRSIPPYTTEVIPVIIRNTTVDGVATDLQLFHFLQKQAAEYWVDKTAITPVWFYCQVNNETSPRNALVKSLAIEFRPGLGDLYECNVLDGVLGQVIIVRHPDWEMAGGWDGPTFFRSLPEVALATGVSRAYDYTAAGSGIGARDVTGDVGARISRFTCTSGAADALSRLWMGMRSANKHGTLANFILFWECENAGATLGTDAARAADATANPGGGGNTKVTITPGTATWAKRLTIELDDVTANESDNFGEFLWLLRAKVSAGTWEVQVRYAYSAMDDDDFVLGDIIELENTSWDIFETDVQVVPLRDLHVLTLADRADSFDDTFAIQIWARRTDGAGTLDLDCLMPLPIDEGWSKMSWSTTGTVIATFGMSPEDTMYGVADTAGVAFEDIMTIEHDGFYLPPGDGRMIIIIARETTSDITDTLQINGADWGKYAERWLSLRGAE